MASLEQNAAAILADLDFINKNTIPLHLDLANLSGGLLKAIDEQKETNWQGAQEIKQNDTVICWLSIIASLLCQMLRRLETQIEIQTNIQHSVGQIKATLELVYGTETVEVLRLAELKKKIDECCPKPKPEPHPCYSPCSSTTFIPYTPKVPEYLPIPTPDRSTNPK